MQLTIEKLDADEIFLEYGCVCKEQGLSAISAFDLPVCGSSQAYMHSAGSMQPTVPAKNIACGLSLNFLGEEML